ncbi:MAG: chloride channel protein [Candidatus Latescibacterota bacterium]|nr:MAG: chloride channel protein [Candidatus Latescibacterota bacterium]
MESDTSRFPGAGMLEDARRLRMGTARGFLGFLRDEHTHFFLLSAVVGLGAAGVALGVRWFSDLITRLAYGSSMDILEAVRSAPIVLRLFVPMAGGVVAGLLVQLAARLTGAGGLSAVMEAVTLRRGFVSVRRTLLTTFASISAMATGGSVGREGPIVQLSSALGSRLGRFFQLTEMRVRVLVAAGVGAGMAAAYNTPIAGTLFVLEVVAGSFATDLIGPTVVAAVVSTLVARILVWEGPIYEVPEFVLRTPQELLLYALIGLVVGLLGVLFLRTMRAGEQLFARLAEQGIRGMPVPRWARTGLGGLIVGMLAVWLPEITGNGYETLVDILNERVGAVLLVVLLLAKMLATTSSVTSGSPGGVFTPTLFVGAAVGGSLGALVHSVFPDTTASMASYALVGMGALLAATTHAPITATVLVAELTGDYVVVLPLLLSCGLAATVTHRMDSVYTHELRRRGIAWEGTLEQKIVHSMKARDLMRTDVTLLKQRTPFEEVVRLFTTTRTPTLYVGDDEGNLTGIIELHAVKNILTVQELSNLLIAQDLAEPARSVPAGASLATVNESLWFVDTGEVAVVEGNPGSRFLGVVTRRDLLGFLDREILRRNLLLGEVHWRDGLEKGVDYLELPEGYRLQAVRVPAPLVGQTLADAQIRSRHGLNVIAVQKVDSFGNENRYAPEPDYILQSADHLIVVGSNDDVATFEKLRG